MADVSPAGCAAVAESMATWNKEEHMLVCYDQRCGLLAES
jgi:hypothetical protein